MPETVQTDGPCMLSEEQARLLIHELRSPMTTITGYTDLLKHHTLSAEETATALDAIAHAVERMDAMLDAVASGRPFERPDLAVKQPVAVREIADRVAADAHATHWRQVSVEAVGNPVINGDPLLVRRALDNLVGNAIKYSSGPVRIHVGTNDGYGRIQITDHGPGIPAEEMQHVFERFARLERDASTPGMGLGLAVVRDIANAHGGSVWIEPATGGGTCVVLELPLAS